MVVVPGDTPVANPVVETIDIFPLLALQVPPDTARGVYVAVDPRQRDEGPRYGGEGSAATTVTTVVTAHPATL